MTKTDYLEDDNKYNCELCAKFVDKAMKTTRIYSLPPILIFCFQRFRGGTKNGDTIEFPIKDLDMSKHIKNDSHTY